MLYLGEKRGGEVMGTHYSGKAVMIMARLKRALIKYGIELSLSDNSGFFVVQRQCAEIEDNVIQGLLSDLRHELGFDEAAA